MLKPGRKYNSASAYGYGFNGQEKSLEIDTFGNLNTAQFWEYDTRIGACWNIDPVIRPWESPYSVMGGSPIANTDPYGDDWYQKKGKISYNAAKHGERKGYKYLGTEFDKIINGNNYHFGGDCKISEMLADVVVTAKAKSSSKPNKATKDEPSWLSFSLLSETWTQKQAATWDDERAILEYRMDHGGANTLIRKGDPEDYVANVPQFYKEYIAYQDWKTNQIGAIALIFGPAAGAAAPELFGVSKEVALAKGLLSFGFQALMIGKKEVDYIGVAADAFTAPGLDGLINGSINWRPFSNDKGRVLQIVGINKSAEEFATDAGTGFFSGLAGNTLWRPLQPLLHNPTERTVFFLSTQAWLYAGSQGANITIKNKLK